MQIMRFIRKFLARILDLFGLLNFSYQLLLNTKYFFDFKLKKRNSQFLKDLPQGEYPFPPPRLLLLMSNSCIYEPFLSGGKLGFKCIEDILNKHGKKINELESVLDFGCGLGRIVRHWHKIKNTKVYATDFNPKPIDWCQKVYPFVQFNVNNISEKLNYDDESFSLIYAHSVFTHIPESEQQFLLKEFHRILKPKGILYITLHGSSRINDLPIDKRQQFEGGELVLLRGNHIGYNLCSTFHPEQYIRNNFNTSYEILDIISDGSEDIQQDVVLLQKLT